MIGGWSSKLQKQHNNHNKEEQPTKKIINLTDLESFSWNRVSCNALIIRDIQGRKHNKRDI